MIHHDTPPNLGVLGVFYFQTKPKKELLAGDATMLVFLKSMISPLIWSTIALGTL